MSNIKSLARETCTLLAVMCGNYANRRIGETEKIIPYPFPEITSAGRVEVHKLVNPSFDQFKEAQRSVRPIILFFQGEQLSDEEEIGSLIWGTIDASDNLASLIDPPLPTIVYLEVPNGEKIAQSLHLKGVPYVIYWKKQFSSYSASHFFEALVSVVQSSLSHTWDAFQLANASFQLYCTQSNCMSTETNCQKVGIKQGPRLLGDAPEIHISAPKTEIEEEDSSETSPAITIYKEDVDVRFLICGLPCGQDAFLLGSLEDGLSALLNVEIRGSKLQNRVSAPPPLEAGTLDHGIVTMRCDITTCSSAHISLLVSGGAQTCFDDQVLEKHIKNELIEKTQLVRAVASSGESYGAQPSMSVACGAPVFEVRMVVPKWASQVLKHVAKEASYRGLVALGIASLDGTPVASFDKRDANRLLFFSRENQKDSQSTQSIPSIWRCSSCPTKERAKRGLNPKLVSSMRPIPHSRKHKRSLYFGTEESSTSTSSSSRHEGSAVSKGNKLGLAPVSVPVVKKSPVRLAPKIVQRKPLSQPVVPMNPLPMKRHGCTRPPIRICPEEEFLKDVMQFLVQRGHNKLVPQGGLSEFPDAILNAKRLDLYNLYKEVVSRGGFYVGNGINWKGQVFSKMRNHTISNRMTGVGNTLKRHYETYLLEYELAHDDVDGECCLLCRSSAPGDWVNCGLCGEWAHFGCDRRQGLGTFKDYAKTDGLEYICPHCSVTNVKKKARFSNGLTTMRTVAMNA